MKLLYGFAQFLISEWIWLFTFAWQGIFINVLMLILLFVFFAKMRMIPAVLLSFFSQLFAVIAYTAFVHLILDRLLGIMLDPADQRVPLHPLTASFLLGAINTLWQTLFFYLVHLFYRLPVQRYSTIAFASNTITALLVYKFLAS